MLPSSGPIGCQCIWFMQLSAASEINSKRQRHGDTKKKEKGGRFRGEIEGLPTA